MMLWTYAVVSKSLMCATLILIFMQVVLTGPGKAKDVREGGVLPLCLPHILHAVCEEERTAKDRGPYLALGGP